MTSNEGTETCECVCNCADDPATACSLSGEFHVHPEWPCAVHPDAPGDWAADRIEHAAAPARSVVEG